MDTISHVSLSHDPIHNYIPFTTIVAGRASEVTERQVIDHPWVQRLRQVHQLQTAWYVFPTAEHTRFQHVVGVMHLASVAVGRLYDSLQRVCPDVPSRAYVESLMRLAGLLHDVGHGPFGHFFDEHYLADYGLTHEILGGVIIREHLGDMLCGIRRTPNGALDKDERLEPEQIAWLITRPHDGDDEGRPRWLVLLRSLLSGIYTIDNMDFVLRDAYMTGYSQRAFDLDRLLHYSFFSPSGLTIHDRGIDSLVRFMTVRAELFRTVYFHRTVRAIDLTLADLFAASRPFLFPGNPLDNLDAYQRLTEWALLVDVSRWTESDHLGKRGVAQQWQRLLRREIRWKMVCQRNLIFSQNDSERSSIFSDRDLVEQQIRRTLPAELTDLPLRIDIARHIYRPFTRGPARDQNFLYDSARQTVRPLTDNQLFQRLPVSHRICRIYAETEAHAGALATALDTIIRPGGADDLTNM